MVVAVLVKVWIKFPGVSFGRSAPWPLLGSSNQFNVIDEPIAFCQVPEPAVSNEATGPMKSVSLRNRDGLRYIGRVDDRE